MNFYKRLSGASVLAVLLAATGAAQAQDNSAPEAGATGDEDEIIVTGTSLRGVAPAGAQVIGLGEEEIAATGATSATELLTNILQLTDFAGSPSIQGSNNTQQTTNRPNIRNLPNFAGGSPTLILMDGHRLPGAGIIQTSPDSDVLAPGVLQRVEVVTDGGSSIYGSDAVGGVVNYITRRSYDGFEVGARQGFGEDFQSTDINFLAGHEWRDGSAYIAYNYTQQDAIYGRDRDYVRRIDWTTGSPTQGLPTNLVCSPANVVVTVSGVRTNYVVDGDALSTGINRCDPTDDNTLFPQQRRDAVFVGFSQDLSEHVRFDLRGYYTNRVSKSDAGAPGTSVTVTTANPFYRHTFDANDGRPQTVSFTFDPVFTSTPQKTELETWGFTPTLTVDLPNDWQLRAFLNYGQSTTSVNLRGTVGSAITNAASGIFVPGAPGDPLPANPWLNPYDVAATDPIVLERIRDSQTYGNSVNELGNARAVFDGPLFSLPGGEVRMAVGGEYIHENYVEADGATRVGEQSTLTPHEASHHVEAFFGELNIPIVGEGNRIPFLYSLGLSLSARYDDYSDFGDTTNPRLGLTYEPVDWLTVRGTWGKSFQAPSLADTVSATPRLVLFPGVVFQNPFAPAPTPGVNYYQLFLAGSLEGLQPEEATSYSVGFDIHPPVAPGLDLSFTYYNIEFLHQVQQPLPGVNVPFEQFWLAPDLATTYPTDAEVLALIASTGEAGLNAWNNRDTTRPVYAVLNTLRQNLNNSWLDGVDASIRYNHDTSFGSIFASLSGTYRLKDRVQLGEGAPVSENLASNTSRVQASATIGADFSHVRAQATVMHLGGFDVTPDSTNNNQSRVDSFQSVNLYFQYDLEGSGLTNDLSFSLSVNNLFDTDPSLYQGTYNVNYDGYANPVGNLGRVIQIGVRKQF